MKRLDNNGDQCDGLREGPYEKCRDSGIEWLGPVPPHWTTKPLKHVVRFENGAAFQPSDWGSEGIPIIRIENLNGGGDYNYTKVKAAIKYHVHSGDLLFGWSGNRGTSFGPTLWNREGLHYLNQHIFRLHGYSWDKGWLYWVLRGVTAYIEKQAHGIIGLVHITKAELGSIKVPCVPDEEQQAIADFLDKQIAQIDALIAKKQRLIELLKEKRAAIISQAVTKGLDHTVPMNDSGIEWLGAIPKHWDVVRAKAVLREIDERSMSGEEELLTVSHITGVTRRSEKDVNMFMAENLEGYKKCGAGDLVINTMWAWMGALGIANETGLVSPSYNVYRFCSSEGDPRYFDRLFRTAVFRTEIGRYSKGVWTSRLRLYPQEFFQIPIPWPPPEDQQRISVYIEAEDEKTQRIIEKLSESIEKLNEYRTALISAAVTGKIDVREDGYDG